MYNEREKKKRENVKGCGRSGHEGNLEDSLVGVIKDK